ncbi:uncharacterized protein GGS25DRAFT_517400 [Hypoxylon fragiforme]|uniref:uncharacterized protein n=1 Tax=Hypoxylon fragiforme TaxID=63214 RepID=UPI0020C72F9D|nr:uncharacterized protein GGS25DRAFT_517400 [Hypoxylon fragiforme]KAI2614551.1 hypothetical protein GGS25DRAFT_517400 [Hypoxylon fragiforme]
MGFHSFIRDERLIVVGLGLSTISFLFAMRTILEYYRDEAEIKPTPPKTQYITQDTEDSLKLCTLESLLGHYNFAIRDTAIKIATGRAFNDSSVIHHLLWGITREDYHERMQALKALAFAIEDKETSQEPLNVLSTSRACSALVRSLQLCLTDVEHEKLDDPLYDEYFLRDIGERRCLTIIYHLLQKIDVEKLIQAGIVEKWLGRQPWGDSDEERQNNFAMYLDRRQNQISTLCFHLQTSRAGRKALIKEKLMPPREAKRECNINVVVQIRRGDGEEADELVATSVELVPRVSGQTAEEQRLRRRHREAMVLNDGTHSLGRSDIIEREHDSNS